MLWPHEKKNWVLSTVLWIFNLLCKLVCMHGCRRVYMCLACKWVHTCVYTVNLSASHLDMFTHISGTNTSFYWSWSLWTSSARCFWLICFFTYSNGRRAWYGKRRNRICQYRLKVPCPEFIPVFRHPDLCSDNDQASQMPAYRGTWNKLGVIYCGNNNIFKHESLLYNKF